MGVVNPEQCKWFDQLPPSLEIRSSKNKKIKIQCNVTCKKKTKKMGKTIDETNDEI